MTTILDRINGRFQEILEERINTAWKDPNSREYDRQQAEDALFHTIGPLTENPRWVNSDWSSPGEPVPGYQPGGPAPRWNPEEVVFAFAGDPNMLFTASGNPRSPMYGNKGGSPLFRTARKVARYYARANDRQFIADLFSNGFIPLVRMMQPGFDEGRSPFISYAIRNIQSAMEHGTGGTSQSNLMTGRENQQGIVGLAGLLDKSDAEEVRALAQQVKGKFQETSSHDKHPDNPFGKYSAAYFRLANQYADALELGDEDRIDAARSQIHQQVSTVEDENIFIPGASTGMGQAISTPDRKTSIDIASMNVSRDDQEGGMAGNIMGDTGEDAAIDPETINKMYDVAINHDLGDIIGSIPKYAEMAVEFGAKAGKIGGKMTVNELRYSIRTMGPLGSNYPGKGTMRANPEIPRDSKGWWEPGSDPEIEPIPGGAQGSIWHSIWSRNNYKSMGPTEISQEMTQEVAEFGKLGIPTARQVKTKTDKRSGREIQEVVSKVAVANTMRSATIKLKFIAMLERDSLGLDESKQKIHPLLEDIAKTDSFDRELIAEACDFAVARLERVFNEVSPPGWKGTVKAMKGKKDVDNPWALAWSMKKKGAKPHYKDDESGEKKKEYADESRMQPVDALIFEQEEEIPPEEDSGDEKPKEEPKAEKANPDQIAAWDASTAMAMQLGSGAKGLP